MNEERVRVFQVEIFSLQISKHGGSLQIRTQEERVFLLGKARTPFEGELHCSP